MNTEPRNDESRNAQPPSGGSRIDQQPDNRPWADQRVTAYVLGELEPSRGAQFEQEMRSDPALAAAVEEARQIIGQLKNWFAEEPALMLDTDRRESILHGISPDSIQQEPAPVSSAATRAGHGSAVVLRWLALAAALVLVVGSVGYQLGARSRAQVMLAQHEVSDRLAEAPPMHEQALMAEESKSLSLGRGLQREELDQTPALGVAEQADESVEYSFKKQPADTIAETFSRSEPGQSTAAPRAGLAPLPSEPLAESPSSDLFSRSRQRGMRGAEPVDSEYDVLSALGDYSELDGVVDRAEGSAARANTPRRHSLSMGMEMEYGSMEMDFDAGMEIMGTDYGAAMGGMGGMGGVASMPTGAMVPQTAVRRPATPSPMAGVRRPLVEDPRLDQGHGPGMAGDRFDPITENWFKRVDEHPLSTFSIDVDTAAYAKVRQFLMESGRLPRPDVVRIEELVNYFEYDYPGPPADGPHPLAADIEIAQCPWNTDHRLARIAIQGKRIAAADRPPCNLVFLIDTSGSMNLPNRLPLVKKGLEMLLDQLNETDRVAMVVYAGSAGLVLDSTPATEVAKIRRALTRLQAGGSTNGGDGIRLAYQTARDHFIPGGINRVILCTDGDFNVGTTSQDELIRLVEQQARGGIDLTVLGFGMGNHNDAMLEQISGRGNGNYAFIDNQQEARRMLVERATSTLFTIARDVKIQVEFNPAQVAAYRLIGYENRMLAKEDFNDDTKDAGEVGAGHSVTALYELIPRDAEAHALPPVVDELKYQRPAAFTEAAASDEVMTVKLRYKPIEKADGAAVGVAGGGVDADSILVEFTASDSDQKFSQASKEYRFAALVAAFGLQLRGSEHRGAWTLTDVLREATSIGEDQDEARAQWIELVRRATELQVSEDGR